MLGWSAASKKDGVCHEPRTHAHKHELTRARNTYHIPLVATPRAAFSTHNFIGCLRFSQWQYTTYNDDDTATMMPTTT